MNRILTLVIATGKMHDSTYIERPLGCMYGDDNMVKLNKWVQMLNDEFRRLDMDMCAAVSSTYLYTQELNDFNDVLARLTNMANYFNNSAFNQAVYVMAGRGNYVNHMHKLMNIWLGAQNIAK